MATVVTTCFLPLTSIDGTDCIGDTRVFINDNFINLSNNVCSLLSTVNALTGILNTRTTNLSTFVKSFSAKDSSTIDLFFNANSYILSADVHNSSLGTIKLGQDITTFGKHLLTSTNIPLSSLAGVKLTSAPIRGQVLRWDGSAWTNETFGLTGLLVDGNKTDITVSNAGLTWTIDTNAVTESKILNGSVTTNKIADGVVTANKIATDAITTNKIASEAVNTAKLSASSVTELKLANDAVTTSKIADATNTTTGVTNSKLRHSSALSIIGRASNSIGAPSDIVASTDNRVLVRTSNALQFGTVPNEATSGSSTALGNSLVLRDSSGSFSAAVVEASGVAFGFIGNLSGKALSADKATEAIQSLSANNATSADQAGKLQNARNITLSGNATGTVSFDGSQNVILNTTVLSAVHSILAISATRLEVARNIQLQGDATGTVSFNGSQNVILQTDVLSADKAIESIQSLSASRAVLSDETTKLQTARRIELSGDALGFVNFDGTQNTTLTASVLSAARAVLANQSTRLQTARRIELSGSIIGAANFDGSSNITINTTKSVGAGSDYFHAQEQYNTTAANNATAMGIRALYGSNTVTNFSPTANGTNLDSRPTNIWRKFNTIISNPGFASIKTYTTGPTVSGSYIEINQTGTYDIECEAGIGGSYIHNIVLVTFDPAFGAPYTTRSVGQIINNDPDLNESSNTSRLRCQVTFTEVPIGIAIIHILYNYTSGSSSDVRIGGLNYPSTGSPAWLTSLVPKVNTASIEITKVG